jgi:hypothetical protein
MVVITGTVLMSFACFRVLARTLERTATSVLLSNARVVDPAHPDSPASPFARCFPMSLPAIFRLPDHAPVIV